MGSIGVVGRRIVLASIAVVGLGHETSAQIRRSPVEAGQGAFQIGVMGLDMTDLNAALSAAGLPPFKSQFLSIGGNGYGSRGRWLIGGEGMALLGKEPATAIYSMQAAGGYGLFRVGYDVVENETIDVFPTMGFGAGGVTFAIRGRSSPTFSDVLNNPARSSRLTSGGFLMSVSLNANVRLQLEQRDSTSSGMLVGASVGYLFSPGTTSWNLDDVNSVAGGPELKIQGVFVRFSFGGWARTQRGRDR